MNKAILVIDMPNNCNECPIKSSIGYGKWCSGYDDARIDNYPKKPDWCPLKELTECEHDWVLYESFVHIGGKDLRYRCKKCGAHMIKNGDIIYQSSDEWQT